MNELDLEKNKKAKVILHMDGDAFFVGVEVAKNPKLKGKPVVTGEERGIVSAFSYEAKALGVSRGMPIFRLKKEFPNVIVLPGDYKSYVKYSQMMFEVVRRYADDVEEYSIDECFADLTGLEKVLKMTYKEIAERIKREINNELNLSVSIGIAPTKVLAKVASKWKKPDGLTIIEEKNYKKFLEETPIEKIWGIGPKTSELLKRKGILTGLDFVNKKDSWIEGNLSKPYFTIWKELNCINVLKLDPELKSEYSSIQKTRTFHPVTNDKKYLLSQLSKHIEEACRKARYYKLVAKRATVILKTKDFNYFDLNIKLDVPINSPETLMSLVNEKINNIYSPKVFYRATGIVLQDLVSEITLQNDLFGNTEKTNKLKIIHKQIDLLEKKFGKRLVHLGSTHEALKIIEKGTDSDDLDRDLLFL